MERCLGHLLIGWRRLCLVSLYSESAGVVGAWLAGVLRYSVGAPAGPFVDHRGSINASSVEGLSGDWRRGAAVFLSFVVLVTGLRLVYERRLSSELVMVLPPPTAGAGGGVLRRYWPEPPCEPSAFRYGHHPGRP